MNRRHFLLRVALSSCAIGLILSIAGCVPGAVVEWTIAPTPEGGTPSGQDNEHLRRLLIALGYVKADSGSRTEAMPNAEFFSFTKSQRFNVALLPDVSGTIRVKFVEHGEKQLSPAGRQQVALIAQGLEKEFGKSRITLTHGPG